MREQTELYLSQALKKKKKSKTVRGNTRKFYFFWSLFLHNLMYEMDAEAEHDAGRYFPLSRGSKGKLCVPLQIWILQK